MEGNEIVLFNTQKKKKRIEEDMPQEEVPLVLMKDESEENQVRASAVSPVLYILKGFWPLDLYPDELIIEERKIIVKQNTFPFFTTISTFPLKKLKTFDVTHALIFSSLQIKGDDDATALKFSWLKPREAQRAKEIVDGLILKENEKIVVMEKDKKKMALAVRLIGQM